MSFIIKIKTFNKQQFDVPLDGAPETVTVHSLQEKIAVRFFYGHLITPLTVEKNISGIAAERQTLLFKGQVLEPNAVLSDYSVTEGVTINVVRRVGKGPSNTNTVKSSSDGSNSSENVSEERKKTESSSTSTSVGLGTITEDTLNSYMKNLGLGSGSGLNPENQSQLTNLFQSMVGGIGTSAGDSGEGMSSMSELLSSIWQTPAMQEYLNDPEKLEASRQAVKNNPFLQPWIQTDPEFAKVIDDPVRWKESMESAKMLFSRTSGLTPSGMKATASNAIGGTSSGASSVLPATEASMFVGESAKSKLEAAQERVKHLDVDLKGLAKSYGHALGQSLINSGLGLDYNQVIEGIKMACTGQEFPMTLSEYERQMNQLQKAAQDFVSEMNWKEANQFFDETANDSDIHVIEAGKIVWEAGETTPDKDAQVANKDSNVMIILQGRLLDGRVFFSCPPADDTGEVVHPLTISLKNAPYALRKGIDGMREGEDRTLYVHPEAAEGMSDLFGDVLPPNALLIFDVELVSADISDMEDTENLMNYKGGFAGNSLDWGEEDLD
eukprot:jgi/Galph1/5343/GphlegSOOS_G3986.1